MAKRYAYYIEYLSAEEKWVRWHQVNFSNPRLAIDMVKYMYDQFPDRRYRVVYEE